MPEIRECIAHFLSLSAFLQFCLENRIDLQLLGLWADASKAEEMSMASDGLVYCLDACSTVYRGTCGAQSSLWPPMWRKVKGKPDPPLIQSLKWGAVSFTNRAIVMDLGPLYFQVSCSNSSFQFIVCLFFLACIFDTYLHPNFLSAGVGRCCA